MPGTAAGFQGLEGAGPRASRARKACAGLAPLCVALAGPAAAQVDATALREMSLEDLMNVEVTSVSRSESTVGESPAAVFVITQDMIRRSGATVIPEVLRMVPGLHVARIDGNKWAVASRGFNGRFAKNLLVQVDGRAVYNPQIAGVFWDGVDVPLEDVERIEVIRGPGASVWGANAVNGIINIVTKKAQDTQGGMVSGGGGNEELASGTFRYGGRSGEHLAYRIHGKGFEHDDQSSPEGDPNDAWRVAGGGMRMDWTPNVRDALTLDAGYTRSVAGTKDRFAMTDGPPFAVSIPADETTEDAHVLGLWSRRLDPDSGLRLQAYWDGWQRVNEFHYRDTRFNTYDVDFQHSFKAGERQKWVWGLGYRYVDADLNDSRNNDGFTLSWLDPHPHMEVFSGFAQDEIAIVREKLALTLGSKLEHNNFTDYEVQPGARLLWTPTRRQSAWAAVSRAVRTPSFTEHEARFVSPPANPSRPPAVGIVANRDLEPEEVWAYELGYRVQPADQFTADAALFYNVHNDLRVNRANPELAATLPEPLTVASQFDNGMSGETYGAELAATWQVAGWWRLYAAYTFLEMQLHRDADLAPSAEALEGQDPQQQVFAQSSFNLPGGVEFDLTGRFVDGLSGFNPTGLPGVSDTVDAYVALDARLAWRVRRNLELAVAGRNLTDERHPEFGTNPFVRSPLVEIERSVYGRATWWF